jgi:hypothetical protein
MEFELDLEATNARRARRSGGSRANAILNAFSPANGVAASFWDNTLSIRDPVTPANNYSGPLINSATGLFNKLTYTRASLAWANTSAGVWTQYANNIPRILLGRYMAESSVTNRIFPSNPMTTQTITVIAFAYTLTFEGTGTVTLSGASTAGPLAGTGVNDRVSLTFTPSAAPLTLTVSGDVRFAGLEIASFGSSFMETVGSTFVRSADSLTLASTLFNLTQAEGTIYTNSFWDAGTAITSSRYAISLNDGTANEAHAVYNEVGVVRGLTVDGGATQSAPLTSALGDKVYGKAAYAYAANDFAISLNGAAVVTDVAGTLPTTTTLEIGGLVANKLGGGIREFAFFGSRISNANMQVLTT